MAGLDGLQYAVISSHPAATHSSRVELIFSVSTHVHLCSCPYAMGPDTKRKLLTQQDGRENCVVACGAPICLSGRQHRWVARSQNLAGGLVL